MNRESAIAHFRRFGASCALRHRSDDRDVIDIQLRNSQVANRDLEMLQYLVDEVDVIGLEHTAINDDGLHFLCCLNILDNIDLANTAITDSGLDVLSNIKTLECLCVEGTKVTAAGVARLEAAVPECYVTWNERPV